MNDALKVVGNGVKGFKILPYNPKDKRDLRKHVNNIYVKNFPETWEAPELTNLFSKYGDIKSIFIDKKKIPNTEVLAPFAFICYEKAEDKEYGP
jgi:RNA recognition motif-containing protein